MDLVLRQSLNRVRKVKGDVGTGKSVEGGMWIQTTALLLVIRG